MAQNAEINASNPANVSKSEFTWIIIHNKLIREPRQFVRSPLFKVDETERLFYLEFYPSGYQKDPLTGEITHADLLLCGTHDEPLVCCCTVTIKVCDFEIGSSGPKRCSVKFGECASLPDPLTLKEWIVVVDTDDIYEFTIHCEFTIESSLVPNPPRLKFDELCEKEHLSDVTLFTNILVEAPVPAHKAILIAASPIFHKMFTQELEQEESGLVTLPNITRATLLQMLQFIYEGRVCIQDRAEAYRLLIAANTYDIVELKKQCQLYLVAHLTVENVLDLLNHFARYFSSCFLEDVIKFILLHEREMKTWMLSQTRNEYEIIQRIIDHFK
ncbi:hypothetical protein TKK_0019107 [Trichogramma kaykai]